MIAEIKEDLLTHAFSVVNPSDTYAYINVVSLEDIEKTIHKYCDKTDDGTRPYYANDWL